MILMTIVIVIVIVSGLRAINTMEITYQRFVVSLLTSSPLGCQTRTHLDLVDDACLISLRAALNR